MARIKLNRVANVLDRVDYPIEREAAAEQFDSVDDLSTELNNVLPIEAVGEPGQSEGDA